MRRHRSYRDLLARMGQLLAAPTIDVPGERAKRNPLAVMSDTAGDPIRGFVRAWAVVGDVLTFYQERIADERALSTAREPLSAYAIVRALGLRPRPAISARTYFAFDVSADAPGKAVALPAGIAVGNIPAPGALPAIFESAEACTAYPAWNRVGAAPDDAPVAVRLAPHATRLVLEGTDAIPSGTALVLRERAEPGTALAAVLVAESLVDVAAGTTLVRWLPTPSVLGGEEVLDALVLPTRIRPFGALAPPFAQASPLDRRRYALGGVALRGQDGWRVERAGLETSPIALAATRAGACGITPTAFVRRSAVGTWTTSATFPGVVLQSLAATPGGRLTVGTTNGGVFVSIDDGLTWLPIGDGFPARAPGKLPKHQFPRLPPVPVRAVAIDESAEVPVVYVATDRGIASIALNGEAWTWRNDGLPGTDGETGFAACAATALAFVDTDGTLLAATTYGVYRSTQGRSWTRIDGLGSVGQIAALSEGRLVAAGPGGVFVSLDGGENWRKAAQIEGTPRGLAAFRETAVVGVGADVWTTDDGGATWARVDDVLGSQVAAVAVGPDGTVAIAAPFIDNPAPDWPGMDTALTGNTLALDREVALSAGDVLVVAREDDERIAGAYRVVSTRTTILARYGMVGPSTIVTLDRSLDARVADVRSAIVAYGARAREVVPVRRSATSAPTIAIPVPRGLPALPAGRRVAIEGRPARVMLCGLAGGPLRLDVRTGTADPVRVMPFVPNPGAAPAPELDVAVACGAGERGAVISRFDGVWRRDDLLDPASTWQRLAVPPVVVTGLAVCAGTLYACGLGRGGSRASSGVYAFEGERWSARPLLAGALRRLFVVPGAGGRPVLWAAGMRGLYERRGERWGAVDARFEQVRVHDVCAEGGTVLVAADDGVHARLDGRVWGRVEGLDDVAVQAVAIGEGIWYVGTRGAGTWERAADGRWKPVDPRHRGGNVRALFAPGGGVVLAAERGRGLTNRGALLPAGIATDVRGFAPLAIADGERTVVAFRRTPVVGGRAGVPMRRFLAAVPFVDAELETLDAGMLLPALRRRIETVTGLRLEGVAIVADAAGRAWRLRGGDDLPVYLLRRELDALAVFEVRVFELAAPPVAFEAPARADADALMRWEVRASGGAAAPPLLANAGELWYASARADASSVAEIATVAAHTPGLLRLRAPLTNAYDARSVVVAANVVEATHGATIPADEPIASGNGTVAGQEARLAGKPLANLLRDGRPVPELQVWLRANREQDGPARAGDGNAVLWQRVETFVESDPLARHYTVRQDADGTARVSFGDGVRGRRLPSGRDNAVARYRIGGGPSGNVEANRLTLFQRPAPGSDRVRNPVAATGGVAAAGVEELRVPAGYAIASLERVVTASDLEDYVRAWPGVAKVDVVRKPRRLRRVPMSFVVTYAMHAGDALDVATLSETLQRVGAAGWEIAVVPCRRRLFEIEARLYVARDVEPGEVVASARRTLVDGLSFERRALRQDVLASEIVASIQGVRGVRAVSLDVFHERGTVTRVVERITGDDGEPDEGASLLLLDVDRLQLVAVTEEESG